MWSRFGMEKRVPKRQKGREMKEEKKEESTEKEITLNDLF